LKTGLSLHEVEELLGHPIEEHRNALARLRSVLLLSGPPENAAAQPHMRANATASAPVEVKPGAVTPESVAAVMGGELVLGRRIVTEADLQYAVKEGLPAAALNNAIDRIGYVPAKFRVVYKRLAGPLTLELSEDAARLARIIAVAEYVFDNDSAARSFLTSPHPLLSDRTPADAATEEIGARKAEEILARIFYGLPA
jgi:putative toxin-antitoxin system antitoxin component (TIGR02293 family)